MLLRLAPLSLKKRPKKCLAKCSEWRNDHTPLHGNVFYCLELSFENQLVYAHFVKASASAVLDLGKHQLCSIDKKHNKVMGTGTGVYCSVYICQTS